MNKAALRRDLFDNPFFSRSSLQSRIVKPEFFLSGGLKVSRECGGHTVRILIQPIKGRPTYMPRGGGYSAREYLGLSSVFETLRAGCCGTLHLPEILLCMSQDRHSYRTVIVFSPSKVSFLLV